MTSLDEASTNFPAQIALAAIQFKEMVVVVPENALGHVNCRLLFGKANAEEVGKRTAMKNKKVFIKAPSRI